MNKTKHLQDHLAYTTVFQIDVCFMLCVHNIFHNDVSAFLHKLGLCKLYLEPSASLVDTAIMIRRGQHHPDVPNMSLLLTTNLITVKPWSLAQPMKSLNSWCWSDNNSFQPTVSCCTWRFKMWTGHYIGIPTNCLMQCVCVSVCLVLCWMSTSSHLCGAPPLLYPLLRPLLRPLWPLLRCRQSMTDLLQELWSISTVTSYKCVCS